jgi:hypothetical protein
MYAGCWYPVWSARIRKFQISAVAPCVGAQDSSHVSLVGTHAGYQVCGNEHAVYRVLRSGCTICFLCGAQSMKLQVLYSGNDTVKNRRIQEAYQKNK